MEPEVTPTYVRNWRLASMASQSVSQPESDLHALFAGLFLDPGWTRTDFTILLIVISIPVSLWAMIRLMLSSVVR